MTKKTFSLFLAICLLMTTLTILPTTAFAKSYADQLRDKGFPESYISKLVSLHNKYPKWDFQPLKTGLNFTAAVKAERSPHSKQLIERQSSLSAAYYCNCAMARNTFSQSKMQRIAVRKLWQRWSSMQTSDKTGDGSLF